MTARVIVGFRRPWPKVEMENAFSRISNSFFITFLSNSSLLIAGR